MAYGRIWMHLQVASNQNIWQKRRVSILLHIRDSMEIQNHNGGG